MIELEFQDGNSTTLSEINIGTVWGGYSTDPYNFRLVNTGDVAVNVQLYTAASTVNPLGTADETYHACLLSLDDHNYQSRVFTNIAVSGFVEVYLKWLPTHVSTTGDKQWAVKFDVQVANTEDICDPLTQNFIIIFKNIIKEFLWRIIIHDSTKRKTI